MIILDKPYVSDFLIGTINKYEIPVLNNPFAKAISSIKKTNLISDNKAVESIENEHELLYTNSENAIGWIDENLKKTKLPNQIELFKNKEKFRELLSKLYPDFYYKKIAFTELVNINYETLTKPFVVKPNVGFFSMGVHIIKNNVDWDNALKSLNTEMELVKDLYPLQVMDATEFIIESYIKGEEYAVDCYFNDKGKPVILNIMEHQFSSTDDVSDRLYFTSTTIIKRLKDTVQIFLEKLNDLAGLTNFPLHIEIRIDNGIIIPIEGNPMRFGGWCTTPDLTYHAYGINSYQYYFEQIEPDWDSIINTLDTSLYSVVILNNATGYTSDQIKSFDYEKLRSTFENTLELRKIDYTKYPLFGFLFTKTSSDDISELEKILVSDLTEFILLKK